MTRPAKTKKSVASKKRDTEALIDALAKRGELNPKHRRDFDQMLDDVAPPATKKK